MIWAFHPAHLVHLSTPVEPLRSLPSNSVSHRSPVYFPPAPLSQAGSDVACLTFDTYHHVFRGVSPIPHRKNVRSKQQAKKDIPQISMSPFPSSNCSRSTWLVNIPSENRTPPLFNVRVVNVAQQAFKVAIDLLQVDFIRNKILLQQFFRFFRNPLVGCDFFTGPFQ